MLLAFDVGNSNIKIALLGQNRSGHIWDKTRISSQVRRTADEYQMFVAQFLQKSRYSWKEIQGIIVSSVVPQITTELCMFLDNTAKPYIILGPNTKTGLKICTEYPSELGSDLVANAVGAYYLSEGRPCIALAFGTATTFTAVSGLGELLGVAIAPGMETALHSLVQNTALLRQVKLEMPRSAIGRNTQEAIRAGLILGQLGAIEYVLQAQRAELQNNASSNENLGEQLNIKIYSTGFFGQFCHQHSHYLARQAEFQEDLLFLGLQQIWARQQ